MIKVLKIEVQDFRGLRDLTIDFKGENFAVCGPNGTGKSGVVDALEFGLTGNISRLSGEGRGEVSLRKHGPHVDTAASPEKSSVTLAITIPQLSKSAVIERNLLDPNHPTV